ncbi:MAG: NADH-quinone oxidoreductase subunit J [Ardenticatenia bacterium]|nr:NADH-quinone oxidoreductase subunit J [Ardenticatenia bacterium]
MNPEMAFFYAVALLMIATAFGMVLARDMVHGVLFMVGNFVLTAVLYLLLNAPFIAAVQLIVYAGAIMVLFLFVVMLLGAQDLSLSEPAGGRRIIGVAAVLILGSLLTFVVKEGLPAGTTAGLAEERLPTLAAFGRDGVEDPQSGAAFGSPQMVGEALYREPYHIVPFELVSLLLLVAMMGAVVIASFGKGGVAAAGPEQRPGEDSA